MRSPAPSAVLLHRRPRVTTVVARSHGERSLRDLTSVRGARQHAERLSLGLSWSARGGAAGARWLRWRFLSVRCALLARGGASSRCLAALGRRVLARRRCWRAGGCAAARRVAGLSGLGTCSSPLSSSLSRLLSSLVPPTLYHPLFLSRSRTTSCMRASKKKRAKERISRHLSGSVPFLRPSSNSYCSFAYSALASLRMGMLGSASFQSARKSL